MNSAAVTRAIVLGSNWACKRLFEISTRLSRQSLGQRWAKKEWISGCDGVNGIGRCGVCVGCGGGIGRCGVNSKTFERGGVGSFPMSM